MSKWADHEVVFDFLGIGTRHENTESEDKHCPVPKVTSKHKVISL